jgi:hypothetical protein
VRPCVPGAGGTETADTETDPPASLCRTQTSPPLCATTAGRTAASVRTHRQSYDADAHSPPLPRGWCTGAGGDHGIAKIWNRREMPGSMIMISPIISTRTRMGCRECARGRTVRGTSVWEDTRRRCLAKHARARLQASRCTSSASTRRRCWVASAPPRSTADRTGAWHPCKHTSTCAPRVCAAAKVRPRRRHAGCRTRRSIGRCLAMRSARVCGSSLAQRRWSVPVYCVSHHAIGRVGEGGGGASSWLHALGVAASGRLRSAIANADWSIRMSRQPQLPADATRTQTRRSCCHRASFPFAWVWCGSSIPLHADAPLDAAEHRC